MTSRSATPMSPGLPLAPPAGMRDLLHPQAEDRAALSAALGRLFQSHGYDLVVTPPFEHADVLERGLATVDRRDVLRFVEPDSGEVALLRPDITPQIARVVATRLRGRPPPFRLRYGGTVIRRRRGRARRHRQIAQVGVEHIGERSVDADVEVAMLACRAADEAGLSAFRLELRHVRLGAALLAQIPLVARDDARAALANKDLAELGAALGRVDTAPEARAALEALPHLYGGREVLADAHRHLKIALAKEPLRDLEVLAERLDGSGLGDRLAIDLGETRAMAYYTGPSFVLLAAGPGEPVGAGGRYDELLGRFGEPCPATGFAMDLGNLEWAVQTSTDPTKVLRAARVVACGGDEHSDLVRALRLAGGHVAQLSTTDRLAALAFARAWGYDAVVDLGPKTVMTRIADEAERAIDSGRAEGLLSWAKG